ncbi:MAG: HAD-IIIA family hydrolase [Lachnospiraceae bacterium]|nr:HAD-IIIA family hydrolase [Lachnospiraceae bacterium]
MKIKALVMDVDGTLTDGGIYMGEKGEVMKRFDVKDGYAIHNMLPQMGIIPIIITGRTSQIVLNRCKELGIKNVVQGSKNKIEDMVKILAQERIDLSETAYIGDDMNDYECMQMVGLRGCPRDAVSKIKEISECITESSGGNGAVREFIDWINQIYCEGEMIR